jgi:hypothetical protein
MKLAREPIIYSELKSGSHLIYNNTRAEENEDGTYSIYLHKNLIAIMYFNGAVRLYSAGYKTATTKQRLNNLIYHTNARLFRNNGEWFISVLYKNKTTLILEFEEGILVTTEGIFKNGVLVRAKKER